MPRSLALTPIRSRVSPATRGCCGGQPSPPTLESLTCRPGVWSRPTRPSLTHVERTRANIRNLYPETEIGHVKVAAKIRRATSMPSHKFRRPSRTNHQQAEFFAAQRATREERVQHKFWWKFASIDPPLSQVPCRNGRGRQTEKPRLNINMARPSNKTTNGLAISADHLGRKFGQVTASERCSALSRAKWATFLVALHPSPNGTEAPPSIKMLTAS